ncbi:hypothetical protein [Rhizobium mongolense]|nr:hypothetical protein [Rhizobium mongolense]MBB4230051.1 hypothetical protein [Rhizobium mongolense]
MRKLADAAFRNHPGLADEMHLDQVAGLQRLGERAKNLPTWNFLNVNGPICRGSLDQFGVKLGLSLHYEATKQIVPVGGAVLLNHYSNVDAFTGEIPPDLLGLFGEGTTLKQGRLEVSKQFRYSSLWAEDTLNISMHLAVFRESFGTLMIVAHDANHLPEGSQVEAFYI